MPAELFVPCAVYSLNDESQKGHWAPRARIRKQIRDDAAQVARAAKIPRQTVPVQLIVEPFECRVKLTDAGNCMASAKAAIDGLRDAGVLDDDSPKFVRAVTFLSGRKVSGKQHEGLRLVIRDWGGG